MGEQREEKRKREKEKRGVLQDENIFRFFRLARKGSRVFLLYAQTRTKHGPFTSPHRWKPIPSPCIEHLPLKTTVYGK